MCVRLKTPFHCDGVLSCSGPACSSFTSGLDPATGPSCALTVAPSECSGERSPDSLISASSSGHRVPHLEFGQNRLAQPHPLQAFELAQRSVESPLAARFVAEQAIQNWNVGNATNL